MPEAKKRAPRRKKTDEFERARVEIENESVNDVSARAVSIQQSTVRDIKKADHVEIMMGSVGTIDAKSVSVSQGGAAQVNADTVDVKQGGIANAQAENIQVTQGGIGLAQAENVELQAGGAVAIVGTTVEVQAGGSQYMLARESIHVDQGGAVVMVAPRIEMENGVAGFVIAREVHGNVRALFDQRGALVFVIAAGIVMGLLARSKRRK